MSDRKVYEISGYYLKDGQHAGDFVSFFYTGTESLNDHRRIWMNEATSIGFDEGYIDEAMIIKANYDGHLSANDLLDIVSSDELADLPLDELFTTGIPNYLKARRPD